MSSHGSFKTLEHLQASYGTMVGSVHKEYPEVKCETATTFYDELAAMMKVILEAEHKVKTQAWLNKAIKQVKQAWVKAKQMEVKVMVKTFPDPLDPHTMFSSQASATATTTSSNGPKGQARK
ncbi:hypothetical protein GGI09_005262 [Coemansia sp. S100]|nr:hypothetical protein GGI09_005262 [Coemansia sp. S100]KAJ2095063.1 hypothetical protein GGI16_005336 [Coemansia sp. S142-1]KAJ2428563.1 hypothetical protein GGF41_001338 [Coemansia sp. RSA 2531]